MRHVMFLDFLNLSSSYNQPQPQLVVISVQVNLIIVHQGCPNLSMRDLDLLVFQLLLLLPEIGEIIIIIYFIYYFFRADL